MSLEPVGATDWLQTHPKLGVLYSFLYMFSLQLYLHNKIFFIAIDVILAELYCFKVGHFSCVFKIVTAVKINVL